MLFRGLQRHKKIIGRTWFAYSNHFKILNQDFCHICMFLMNFNNFTINIETKIMVNLCCIWEKLYFVIQTWLIGQFPVPGTTKRNYEPQSVKNINSDFDGTCIIKTTALGSSPRFFGTFRVRRLTSCCLRLKQKENCIFFVFLRVFGKF